jgi:hypothetical protein
VGQFFGIGGDLGADIAGGARPVVDDQLLIEPLRQRLRRKTPDHVRPAQDG